MRVLSGLAILIFIAALAPPAKAQYGAPPGSYQSRCRDIEMQGPFLKAWCRGVRGSGESSINVQSCATDIGVDPDGGLICGGGRPGGLPPPGDGYYPGSGAGGDYYPSPGGGRGWSATLYEGPGYRGRSIEVHGDTPNLDGSGLNDRVGSIRFGRRSGPWVVCSDAGYGGRCVTVERNVRDTGRFGMAYAVSSLRPLR